MRLETEHYCSYAILYSYILLPLPILSSSPPPPNSSPHHLQAIEQVSESADHRVVDVFVLFILHSIPGRKKSVEALFSNKIRHFLFTEDLMANVFRSHAGVQLFLPPHSSIFSLPLFISFLPFPLSLSPLHFSFFFFPCYLLRLFVSSFRASSLSVRHSSAPPLPPSPPSPPHSISTSFQLLTSIADRSVCLSVCLFLSLLS